MTDATPPSRGDHVRTLFIVAHPALPLSHPDTAVVTAARHRATVEVHDLYARYQSHPFDGPGERAAATTASQIVVHYPVLQHRHPQQLTRWVDAVLRHGHLRSTTRTLQVSTTVQPSHATHDTTGRHLRRITEHLMPLRHDTRRAGLHWAPPLVLTVPERATSANLEDLAELHLNSIVPASSRLLTASDSF